MFAFSPARYFPPVIKTIHKLVMKNMMSHTVVSRLMFKLERRESSSQKNVQTTIYSSIYSWS